MLLVAAITQNPGIASEREAKDAGVTPMEILRREVKKIATVQGIELIEFSDATLKKDLGSLRKRGILPEGRARRGYYAGSPVEVPKPAPISRKASKSKLTAAEIVHLRSQGKTFQAIGDLAGVSRARAEQIYKAHLIQI